MVDIPAVIQLFNLANRIRPYEWLSAVAGVAGKDSTDNELEYLRYDKKINMQKASRMKRELAKLAEDPPEGICCYPKSDKTDMLSASILGPLGSPYEGGLFQLEVEIPESYPFQPPRLKFLTPVYHPNIDEAGRICMNLLKMPPKGDWKPTINIENLLTAVQLLLGSPNPDDPLMAEIAEEYRFNKVEFERKARKCTKDNATKKRKNEFD